VGERKIRRKGENRPHSEKQGEIQNPPSECESIDSYARADLVCTYIIGLYAVSFSNVLLLVEVSIGKGGGSSLDSTSSSG